MPLVTPCSCGVVSLSLSSLSLSLSLLVASEAGSMVADVLYIYIDIHVSKTTSHVDCLRILNPRSTSVPQTEAAVRRLTRSSLSNDKRVAFYAIT
jgi:hypothetical protein